MLAIAATAVIASRRAESAAAGAAQGATSLSYVRLQSTTPGVEQLGHANISGTMIAGNFSGDGAALTGLDANSITAGTLSDARLSANVAFLNSLNSGAAANALFSCQNTGTGEGILGIGKNGVHGRSASSADSGVLGENTAAGNGVSGITTSAHNSNRYALLGTNNGAGDAVSGTSATGTGVVGNGDWGAVGNGRSYGVIGNGTTGVGMYAYNRNSTYNVALAGTSFGIEAFVGNTICIDGTSNNSTGVIGRSSTGTGVIGVSADGTGMRGDAINRGNTGYLGLYNDAVFGESTSVAGNGLKGTASNGSTAYGVWGISTTGYAGYFSGNVYVAGNFSSATKSFKIDHPLDPENKVLVHSCVESDQRMNIYKGHATTNAQGEAWVQLPDYFEALNADIEYHLTVMGQFAQAIVGQEVANNRFLIRTDKPNIKVSWQVLGVRQDAYAKAHPMKVEEDKPEEERGTYLNPKEFGQPESRASNYAKLKSADEHRSGPVPARHPFQRPKGG